MLNNKYKIGCALLIFLPALSYATVYKSYINIVDNSLTTMQLAISSQNFGKGDFSCASITNIQGLNRLVVFPGSPLQLEVTVSGSANCLNTNYTIITIDFCDMSKADTGTICEPTKTTRYGKYQFWGGDGPTNPQYACSGASGYSLHCDLPVTNMKYANGTVSVSNP
jgi:hypothetical protein